MWCVSVLQEMSRHELCRRPWWGGSDESKRPTLGDSDKALMMLESLNILHSLNHIIMSDWSCVFNVFDPLIEEADRSRFITSSHLQVSRSDLIASPPTPPSVQSKTIDQQANNKCPIGTPNAFYNQQHILTTTKPIFTRYHDAKINDFQDFQILC